MKLYVGPEGVLGSFTLFSLLQVWRKLEFIGPGLCGNIFTCGALEDGSLTV